MDSDQAKMAEVPHDVGIGKKATYVAANGKEIKFHTLKLKGVLQLLSAVKSVGMKDLPASLLSPVDFLTDEQRAELAATPADERTAKMLSMLAKLNGEQRFLLRESERRYKQAIFDWVCECESLLPVALSACTNLSGNEIESLDAVDALEVLTRSIELQDWPTLIEAASRFFGRIGGLLRTAGRQSQATKAASETSG